MGRLATADQLLHRHVRLTRVAGAGKDLHRSGRTAQPRERRLGNDLRQQLSAQIVRGATELLLHVAGGADDGAGVVDQKNGSGGGTELSEAGGKYVCQYRQ